MDNDLNKSSVLSSLSIFSKIINNLVKFYQLIHYGFVIHHLEWIELLFQKQHVSQRLGHIQWFKFFPHRNQSLLLANSLRTLVPRHKIMTFLALSTISIFYVFVRRADIDVSPLKSSIHFFGLKLLASLLSKIQNRCLRKISLSLI